MGILDDSRRFFGILDILGDPWLSGFGILEDSWGFLMILDDSWGFLGILGGFSEILDILGPRFTKILPRFFQDSSKILGDYWKILRDSLRCSGILGNPTN